MHVWSGHSCPLPLILPLTLPLLLLLTYTSTLSSEWKDLPPPPAEPWKSGAFSAAKSLPRKEPGFSPHLPRLTIRVNHDAVQ